MVLRQQNFCGPTSWCLFAVQQFYYELLNGNNDGLERIGEVFWCYACVHRSASDVIDFEVHSLFIQSEANGHLLVGPTL